MPKNQHFVPQVYLKAWETTVYSLKEPTKPFNGVYKYTKHDLILGDGCNKNNILAKNHTYTIDGNFLFLIKDLPEVEKEFLSKLKDIISRRKIKCFYKDKELVRDKDYIDNLLNVENWEFRKIDNSKVKQRAVINEIKDIRCYCIETKFDSFMEKKWENVLNNMLSVFPMKRGEGQLEVRLNKENIEDMLTMLALMMCRNPAFELYGLFDWATEFLSDVFKPWDDVNEKNKYLSEMRKGLWLTHIYRGLFQDSKGFVEIFTNSASEQLGIMVLRVRDNSEGSFITSDNPVVHCNCILHTQDKRGIYFPLTPRVLLFIGKNTDGCIEDVIFRTVKNNDIRSINQIILNGSTKQIVSNYKRLGYIL